MKSNIITIDNHGNGFTDAVGEAKKVAAYNGLEGHNSLQLQLITEEMLSMARSVTGEMRASFWIENEGPAYELHMTTKAVLDRSQRSQLIGASSSRTNEAATSFIGRLRDAFEQAMAFDPEQRLADLPDDILNDLPQSAFDIQEWDGYEQSVLKRLADHISISIRGVVVDMTVSKTFPV